MREGRRGWQWRCGADGGPVVIAVRTWYCRNLSKKRKYPGARDATRPEPLNFVESVVVVVLAAVVVVVVEGPCKGLMTK